MTSTYGTEEINTGIQFGSGELYAVTCTAVCGYRFALEIHQAHMEFHALRKTDLNGTGETFNAEEII